MPQAAEPTSTFDFDTAKGSLLNLTGVVFYYRSFIKTLVSEMRIHADSDDKLIYDLRLELTHHEVQKLKRFANSVSDAETLPLVQDTTEIVRNMFSNIEPFVKPVEYKPTLVEYLADLQIDPRLYWLLFASVSLISIVFLP